MRLESELESAADLDTQQQASYDKLQGNLEDANERIAQLETALESCEANSRDAGARAQTAQDELHKKLNKLEQKLGNAKVALAEEEVLTTVPTLHAAR